MQRIQLYRILRDRAPRYFNVDDALFLWQKHGKGETCFHNVENALGRLVGDGVLRRQTRGLFEVKK